jgi:hypothetical protein
VLRDGGLVLICTVNREWADFNPSPFSTRYFSAGELRQLLERQGFAVELYGAFPVSRDSIRERVLSLLKRSAVALHLIPRTMKGRELLKKLVFGQLAPIPHEVTDGMAQPCPLVPITAESSNSSYKVLYAVGRVR